MPAGITSGFCQLFFAWRISVLIKNPYLTALIVIVRLLTTQLSFSVGVVGASGTIDVVKSFERFHFQGMKIFGSIWLVFARLCDVMISVVLTWYLEKNRASTKNTNNMLDRIVAITLANGALTRYFSCQQPERFLAFLTHTQCPDTGVHYTNSVMSSLNLRKMNRGYTQDIVSTSGMSSGHGSRRPPLNDPLTVVHVSTEQHELQDGPYGWDTTKHITFGPADTVTAHPKHEQDAFPV
ncbi:hypothetical protein C8J57DRAFT_1359251 [Mycena rebaudengoi]|nr:hypothetical protein C8J57DRAFT_1359251 [Mycena rebaudengoi]